ncbi:MAG: hypothetical protein ACRDDY_13700 [Clostridium sp.]|uniref:hypothetical protein n=1 Tax=Clostridium sp. TaxID=1506 RepID=UPI003EE42426
MKAGTKKWHRKSRVTKKDALMNKFVPNGYGNTKATATNNVNSDIKNGLNAQEIIPFVRDNVQRARDARDIYNISPDLKYAAAMGTAMILSTDDLITVSVIYESSSNNLSLEMRSRLAAAVNNHMRSHVKLNDKLYDIVYNMRFVYGSYPIVVLPEASVNDIINGDITAGKLGHESRSDKDKLPPITIKNLGILGSPNDAPSRIGIESYFVRRSASRNAEDWSIRNTVHIPEVNIDELNVNLDFSITDNIQVLRLPEIKRQYDSANVSSYLGNENYTIPRAADYWDKIEEEKPDVDLFTSKTFKYQHIVAMKAANMTSRPSVDHPMLWDLPAASVTLVHSPGTFLKPIGAIVLLDELGYPISENNHHTMILNNHISRNMTSVNIDAVAKATGVAKNRVYSWTERRLAELTRDMVTAKFVNSIKNGNYGHDNIQLADNDSFIRTMMAASLSNKRTQLLFIPAEQLTYFATEYDENGIGISVIESAKILASMCIGNKFASMHAAINNARAITTASIRLDPDELDPEAKIERHRDILASSVSQPIPITGSAEDWNKHIANRGVVINIEGNEHYPSTTMDIKTETSRYEYPDESIALELKKDLYTAMGTNPSVIMDGGPVETATEVTVKDLHAAKLAMTEQSKLSPQLTHLVKSYIYSDPLLLDELAKIVEEVINERVSAKRLGKTRLREAEAKEELEKSKEEEGDQPIENSAPAPEGEAPTNPDSVAPEGSTEKAIEDSADDQNEDQFVFESYSSKSIKRRRLGLESFVDFYAKADKMTPDSLEELNTPSAIRKILSEFISTLTVSLPGPENAKIESAMDQLNSRFEHFSKVAEWCWPDGTFPDESMLQGKETALRNSWVSYEMVNYIRSRDLFPSLTKIVDYDIENDSLKELIDDIVKRQIGAMTIMKNINDRASSHSETLELNNDDGSSGSDTTTDNNDGGDTWDSEQTEGGGEDPDSFDFDADLSGDDNPPASDEPAGGDNAEGGDASDEGGDQFKF